jgi:hypothetical protein
VNIVLDVDEEHISFAPPTLDTCKQEYPIPPTLFVGGNGIDVVVVCYHQKGQTVAMRGVGQFII